MLSTSPMSPMSPDEPNEFGKRLRVQRNRQNMTLDKVAELTDLSKSYIWELENRACPRPSAEVVYRLSKVFHLSMEYLLGYHDDENQGANDHFYQQYAQLPAVQQEQLRRIAFILDPRVPMIAVPKPIGAPNEL